MTVENLRQVAQALPEEAEVLVYVDRLVPVHMIEDQPMAWISGYYAVAAERDPEVLTLIMGEEAG